jgi:hypothetical protein
MLIRFKNKMTMAIIQMINQGKQLGGLPSHVEISADEATLIVEEINALREQKETQHQRYKFLRGEADARLSVLSRELSKDEKLQLLADWTSEKLAITFDGVQLKVVIVADKDKKYHD